MQDKKNPQKIKQELNIILFRTLTIVEHRKEKEMKIVVAIILAASFILCIGASDQRGTGGRL
jgi:hypothetical protein